MHFGGKKKAQAKPNQNTSLPPKKQQKQLIPLTPQNISYHHVLWIYGLQAMRRVFQAPKKH